MAKQTPESKYYTTRTGTTLHYLQTGTSLGPLLLCLHGLGGSSETFIPLLPHFPTNRNIVLLDFQGFGKTSLNQSAGPVSVAKHAADVEELIAALQGAQDARLLRETVIIGHSLGTMVALQYAAQRSDAIGGLVLLGVARSAGNIPTARQRMYDLATAVRSKGITFAADLATKSNFYQDTPKKKADPWAKDEVRRAVLASDSEGYAQTCEAIVSLELKDPAYENIICPVVFVAGNMDMISPEERARGVSALLGGPSWIHVVRSGHQPILEDLYGVVQAIDMLLSSVALCSSSRSMRDQ